MKYIAWATFLLAACTVSNPLYTGGGGDGGSNPQPDFSGIHDGGTHDLPKPPADFAQPGACVDGDRKCEGTVSEICQGGQFVPDRQCPSGSTCMNGLCQPPPPGMFGSTIGMSCSVDANGNTQPVENLCFGTNGGTTQSSSCEPFVDAAGNVTWDCAAPIGMGVPGTPCTDGSQCRTGFCGSNGTCFRGCSDANQCPRSNGQSFNCDTVTIVVEGVSVDAMSCIP